MMNRNSEARTFHAPHGVTPLKWVSKRSMCQQHECASSTSAPHTGAAPLRRPRGSTEESCMFTSTKAMRLAAMAVVAFFGGLSTPAWATYGGGACHRCAPPAVIESQCSVVALAPQVQTVFQTV